MAEALEFKFPNFQFFPHGIGLLLTISKKFLIYYFQCRAGLKPAPALYQKTTKNSRHISLDGSFALIMRNLKTSLFVMMLFVIYTTFFVSKKTFLVIRQ